MNNSTHTFYPTSDFFEALTRAHDYILQATEEINGCDFLTLKSRDAKEKLRFAATAIEKVMEEFDNVRDDN